MSTLSLRDALAGISGVHVTPYAADGHIDTALLAKVVDRIAAGGIHNIVSAGNTGEFYALEPDEVRAVHDGAIAANAGRSKLTAAVGRSLREAIALGRRARDAGADALMAHQPMDPFAAPQSPISPPSPTRSTCRWSPMCAPTPWGWPTSPALPTIRTWRR